VINEEVRVGKRTVQNTEQVSDNVRHEELRVEKDGNVDVNEDVSKAGRRKKPAA
jgi:stress response protein YsnF